MAEFDPEKLKSSKPTFDPSRLSGKKAEKGFTPTYGEGSFDAGPSAPMQDPPIIEPITTKKTFGTYGKDEDKFDPTGKGLVGDPTMRRVMKESAVKEGLGVGGGIESLFRSAFLPSEIKEKYPKSKEPILPTPERVGKAFQYGEVPKGYEPAAAFGGMLGEQGVLLGAGELPAAARFISGAGKTGKVVETAEDVLAKARGFGEEITTSAKEKAAKERLSRKIAMDKEMARAEKIPPEVAQIHDAARSETKFAAPDTAELRAAGKDVNSEIRNTAATKLVEAEKRLSGGGDAFKSYLDLGKQLEASQPVAASPAGNQLNATLSQMSVDMSLTPETRALASSTKNKLFPKDGNEAFNTFDVEFRRLKDKAAGKSDIKIGPEDARILTSVANPIEQALKGFVGEKNYARPIYAEEAKDLNKFRQDLGEALASREKGQYEPGKGEIVSVKDPAKVLFSDRNSVEMGRQLLGEQQVNALAERHAINQLNGKSAKDISKWLNETSNDYVYGVPGLWEKVQKYGERVARGEGDAKAFEALQKQWKDHTATVEKQYQDVEKIINTAARKISKTAGPKLETAWLGEGGAPGLRAELENTKLFNKADLDSLETQLLKASQIAETESSRQQFMDNVKTFVKIAAQKSGIPVGKLGVLGAAGYGIYEGLK